MKRFWIVTLASIVLWPMMAMADDDHNRTRRSHDREDAYEFTVIAEFKPPFGSNHLNPSNCANGPVITNDGVVVYSAGSTCQSLIFSSDGTNTRFLNSADHMDEPLQVSVSGNGMMVTNSTSEIIAVYNGTTLGNHPFAATAHGVGQISINNRGSVAFTGNAQELCSLGPGGFPWIDLDAGVFRFDGDTITTIAEYGTLGWITTVMAFPSINDSGRVAFHVGPRSLGNNCRSTVGLEEGYLFIGDGKHLVEIAEANSAPSLNNRGEVGFIGTSDGALSVLVSDGKKTRLVADTRGAFTDFPATEWDPTVYPYPPPRSGVSINDRGEVVFVATVHGIGDGIFTGPDVDRDKVIATGDLLAGSSVSGEIILSRQSLNKKGQIAFQATLANGRIVIVRADKGPGVN